jgi:hypothetical protein
VQAIRAKKQRVAGQQYMFAGFRGNKQITAQGTA